MVEVSQHRPALDGLRALAVAGVVTYHLGFEWLPGGFLGVDLFFVLSGFLITGILLDELKRHGTIAFSGFFARRARRLLPALYLLILVVCAWAAFVAAPNAIGDLRGAGLAAVFYVANWFFILTGQSYFSDIQGPSPLEHTWSLAIEEQFYLFWPILLLFLLRRFGPRALAVTTLVLLAASTFLMAVLYNEGDPFVAYFGTFSRMHELLVGCVLAITVKRGLTLPAAARWSAWIPLALIVIMMVTVSDTGAFYYRGGSLILCVLAAWLILALGAGAPGGGPTTMLSWKPIVWIGLISYGIYLWHWPLILWLNPVSTGLTGISLAIVRISATVLIAAASFYLLERPIRQGRIGDYALTPRRLAVIVPTAMAVMALAIIASTTRAVALPGDSEDAVAPSSLLGSSSAAAPVVAFTGDSILTELMPQLSGEAASRGWSVLPLAFRGCSVTGTFQVDDRGDPFRWSERCSDDLASVQSRAISDFDPDVVVWYSNRERFGVRVDDQVFQPGTPQHQQRLQFDLETAYQRLAAGGAEVVIVLPVPKAPPVIGDCALGSPTVRDCELADAYYASFASLHESLEELAARHPDRIRLVHIDDVLCPGGRDCPLLEQEGAAARPDGIHFSAQGADWFVPLLFDRAGLDAQDVTASAE